MKTDNNQWCSQDVKFGAKLVKGSEDKRIEVPASRVQGAWGIRGIDVAFIKKWGLFPSAFLFLALQLYNGL